MLSIHAQSNLLHGQNRVPPASVQGSLSRCACANLSAVSEIRSSDLEAKGIRLRSKGCWLEANGPMMVLSNLDNHVSRLQCRRSPVHPAQVCLTGHGWYDGTGKSASGASTGKQLQYIAFGAAVCEVCLTCTTTVTVH